MDKDERLFPQSVADVKELEKYYKKDITQLIDDLGTDLKKAEEYGDELRDTLRKHNLTHLANKKPGMIEKRMQDATDKLWDDLESVTGDNTTN